MNHNVVIKITLKGAFKTGFKIGVAAAGFKIGYETVRAIDVVLGQAVNDLVDTHRSKKDRADSNAKVYEYHTAEEENG